MNTSANIDTLNGYYINLFLAHMVNESAQLISLHFPYERPKQGIGSRIALIDEKIMKLEFQIVMLQSELIQVNFDWIQALFSLL